MESQSNSLFYCWVKTLRWDCISCFQSTVDFTDYIADIHERIKQQNPTKQTNIKTQSKPHDMLMASYLFDIWSIKSIEGVKHYSYWLHCELGP